jgi:hypothetical protein
MATLGASVLTKLDFDKRLDPNGTIADITELLAQQNPILNHVRWKPSNQPTSHLSVVRTSLPGSTWRRFNQGVTPTKSTTRQIVDSIGMLEAWSEVDKDLAELNGNTNEFRLSEATAQFEGMNQEFSQTFFYGDTSLAQEEFTGLAPRYADPAGTTGDNIIDVGGSSTGCASIWLVGHGENTVFGIYPKGSTAGLMHESLGLQTVNDATGVGASKLRAYQDHYQWKCGLAVKDWRYVVRAGSIKIATLTADTTGASIPIISNMIRMLHRIPNLDNSGVNLQFYVSRTVGMMLDIQANNKSNVNLYIGEEEGKRKLMFRGIPINTTDAISENETAI